MKARISALLAFLTICMGSFAAHGLKEQLGEYGVDIFHTATFYGLTHSIACVLLPSATLFSERGLRWGTNFLLAGALIFSLSLYALGLSGQKWLGAITPIGGTFLLCGWLILAASVRKA